MAELGFDFVAADVEEMAGFDAIPAGNYLAAITSSEMKDTKSGGKMLVLTFQILEGKFAKRLVWHNLNLVNASEVAVNIARSDLKKIADSCGIQAFSDSAMLHDIPLVIHVAVEKYNGKDQNRLTKFERPSVAPAMEPVVTVTDGKPKPNWVK